MESESKSDVKLRGKVSESELILEEKLKYSELKLILSLERNVILEKDLVKVKDNLNKSLKWENSFRLLGEMTNHKGNEKKGLDYPNKIDPPYNPPGIYISVFDNLLCLLCGRIGHLKGDCGVLK